MSVAEPVVGIPSDGKVLIVLLGAIGDVCRALPLAVRIKRAHPNIQLHWAVEPKSAELVLDHGSIDRVIVFDRRRGLLAYRRFIQELQAEQYALVLDLQRHFKSGLTTLLTRAPRRVGFHRTNSKEFNWLFNSETLEPVDNFSPKILQYQHFGDRLELPPLEPLEFGLPRRPATTQQFQKLLGEKKSSERNGGAAALIMGSSWASRFWPAEHYGKLVREFERRWKLAPILIGGPGEVEFTRNVLTHAGETSAINLVGQSSLKDLIAVLGNVRFAVAPDCGPAHIAAAVGTPVITLFGSTDVHRSVPYGFERFALRSTIGCSPCYRRTCPGLNTLCMREIPVEAVCAQIEALTKGSGAFMDATRPEAGK